MECGGLPAIITFQRHSTQHPSIVGPLPTPSCSGKMPLPVVFSVLPGCSACGLGYPHQVLVGSPHVHSSRLVPVSFAGFLIKCLHFISTTWFFAQVRPHVALRGRLRAVWALSTRGVLSPVSVSWFFFLPLVPHVCPCFMSTAQLRCDAALFAIRDISAGRAPFPMLSQSCQSASR
jgi:hypothetical protein